MRAELIQWILIAAALLGALKPILGLLGRLFGALFQGRDWLKERENQAEEIKKLRQDTEQRFLQVDESHKRSIKEIKEEQSIIIYGNLACLKGLEEQGCNGPVREAIERIEKYLNHKAHE